MKDYHIAVVGATGAVGQEILRVLERRNFPVASLHPISSARSAGKSVRFRDESVSVLQLNEHSFEKIDVAFFSAGGEISRKYVPLACQAEAIVIDNSSAFRMDAHVPLVIPEINAEDARRHRGLIANPNCTTAITLMALFPLHRVFGVRRIFAASYQAVSGSGARAIDELTQQTKGLAADQEACSRRPVGDVSAASANQWDASHSEAATVFPHPIAFNLLPHVDSFLETGYTKEEMKMQNEARKIMHLPQFCASVTCVR
ncbi:MAG: aspartate-semialdehyde dehydrogenase, partial [Verrucomicrobia bacterium]